MSSNSLTVHSLLNQTSATWDRNQLQHLYPHSTNLQILKLPFSLFDRQDRLVWTQAADGQYSVSQGYHQLLAQQEASSFTALSNFSINWEWLWKIDLPPKFLLFLWRLLHHAIPTTAILQQHHLNVPQSCVLCSGEDESLHHLFVHCHFARAVWFGSSLTLLAEDFSSWLRNYLTLFCRSKQLLASQCKLFIILLYYIWEARNRTFHDGVQITPAQVITKGQIFMRIFTAASLVSLSPASRSSRPFRRLTLRYLHTINWHRYNILHFFIHRNRGTLCLIGLLTHQGAWKNLLIWRNVDNKETLHFLFQAIRECFASHLTSLTDFTHIVLQKKGHINWLTQNSKPPLSLQPLIDDIKQLLSPHTTFLIADKISRNLLRHILQFLPYSYFHFGPFVSFSF